MSASDELQPGDVIGGYEIVREIGRGGMGVVYKAREVALHRVVALKVLPANLARDPNFIQRFYREARAVAQLEHQNIVTIYNLGQEADTHYIAMQFVRGEALSDIIKREGALEPRRALEIARQTAEALGMAHRRGIIHRDVKPHNVMIDEDGRAKVMDFGIAKIVEDQGGLTRTGDMIGTPAYMSPEQCRGQNVDGRSDIYSLGVMLYQSLTGHTPFRAETPIAMIQKILFEAYDPIPAVQQRRLPKSIDTILSKSLAKDPESRYATAEIMAEDLRRAMESLPVTGAVTIPGMPGPTAPQLIVTPPPGLEPAAALAAAQPPPPPTPLTAMAPAAQYAPPPQYAPQQPQYPPPYPPPYAPQPAPEPRGGSFAGTLVKGVVLGFALIGLIAAAGIWFLREKPEDSTVTVEKIASFPRESQPESNPLSEAAPERPASASRPEREEAPRDALPERPRETAPEPAPRETSDARPEAAPAPSETAPSPLSRVISSLSRRRDLASDAEAQRVLLDAVEKQDPLARMAYAIAQNEGSLGFAKQEQRAKTLAATTMPEVEKLADAGDPEAQYLLGRAAQAGLGRRRDTTAAVDFYQAAAAQGHAPSMNALARMYDSNEAPGPNPAQATFWRQRAARKGDPEAMHNMAVALQRGEGVDKDPAAAMDLLRQAAEAGVPESMRDLGLAYQNGEGVRRDPAEAARWFDAASKAGDTGSMNNLAALTLEDAEASPTDRAAAIQLLRRAADAGSAEAMTNLGSAYEQGLGVRPDPAEAAGWYQHAAEAGDPVAMHNLASCYEEGFGVRADPDKAMEWRKKAADAGQPDAMNDLGWAHETGSGVKRNVDEAIVWYRKAARAGSKTALENLKRLDVAP